jgi:subtilisin family serine protease
MKDFMRYILFIVSFFIVGFLYSQEPEKIRPDNWMNLDPMKDKVNGVSTERTYTELLKNKTPNTIVVGVLDSGVDFDHEDLKDVMWTNPGEIPDNGVDDDKNGYIDDIHGWNFLGNKDGTNVECENFESTRLLRKLKSKYDGKTIADCKTKEEKEEFKLYEEVKKNWNDNKEKFEVPYTQTKFAVDALSPLNDKIKADMQVTSVTKAVVEKFDPKDRNSKQLKMWVLQIFEQLPEKNFDELLEILRSQIEQLEPYVKCMVNLDYDPRKIIGDNYEDVNDRYYGNPDCNGPASFHGTHVAGIIAAKRGNGIGMDGIAANVKIMAVRCVPNGDEHDKDVANAIRYAVDNGATILNMSFGKKFSWNKKIVDDAVKYAESKGVLLIHAAGNDNVDIDVETHYPCKKYESGKEATNFIDIGALSWKPNTEIIAPFSNYGKKTVDLFSPGVDIKSTTPHSKYADASGTSMAAPVACGVAAVLRSYYPTLTPQQIKKILIKSSLKTYKGKKVIKPGTKDELIKFDKLTKNAGIVNLYEAVLMAEKFTKTKT